MENQSSKRSGARLGQHFLMHPRIAERIVAVAPITPGNTVLEVGPGRGILTESLLAKGAKVVAVEADAALIPALRERFASQIDAGRLVLIHADIRSYLASAMPELGRHYAVVANIPYYLTGELLRALLEQERQPSSMTLLVQKEVASRIARDKKGSVLALSVRAYGEPAYAFTVPRGAFTPPPKVDSAVLVIRDISRERFASRDGEALFFKLVRAGFAHKRKRLAKNLRDAGFAEEAESVDPGIRAEDLPLAEWFILARNARE